MKKQLKKLSKEMLRPEEKKYYIRKLYGRSGEPLIFKFLIEDAYKKGRRDGIKATTKKMAINFFMIFF